MDYQVLQVKVFSNSAALESNKPIFERILEFNPSVSIPFEKLLEANRIYFPNSITNFVIS